MNTDQLLKAGKIVGKLLCNIFILITILKTMFVSIDTKDVLLFIMAIAYLGEYKLDQKMEEIKNQGNKNS